MSTSWTTNEDINNEFEFGCQRQHGPTREQRKIPSSF